MTTFNILEDLQTDIGSRRATTANEKQAQEWLKTSAERLGLFVEMERFTFIGHELYRPAFTLFTVTGLTICLGLSLAGNEIGSLIGFGLLFGYLTFVHRQIDVRLAQTESHNVLAGLTRPFSQYVADPNKGTAVLMCAHYDTPRNFPPFFRHLRKVMNFLSPLAMLGWLLFVVVTVIGAIVGASPLLSTLKWLFASFSFPLILLAYVIMVFNLLRQKSDSPGADDNGSGTALVMAVAQHFKQNPPQNIELFFAWWGAEEVGLFGSRQFVRHVHDKLDKEKLHIVNADCVGVGEFLTVHTGQGW